MIVLHLSGVCLTGLILFGSMFAGFELLFVVCLLCNRLLFCCFVIWVFIVFYVCLFIVFG